MIFPKKEEKMISKIENMKWNSSLSKWRLAFQTIYLDKCIYWALFLPRTFGTFPFDHNFKYIKSKSLLALFLLLGVWASTVWSSYIFLSQPFSLYENQKLVDISQIVLIDTMFTLGGVSTFLNRVKHSSILEGMSRIDSELNKRGEIIIYDYTRLLVYCSGSAVLILIKTVSLYEIRFIREGQTEAFLWFVLLIFLHFTAMHLLDDPLNTLLHLLSSQLKHLNKLVKSSWKHGIRIGRLRKMEILADMSSTICDISFILNKTYGFQMLVTVTAIFLLIVTNFYVMLRHGLVVQQALSSQSAMWFYTTNLAWVSFWLLELWYIVSSCVNTSKESKEFNKLLYELMIEDKTNELAKDEKLQLHVAMKREANFTACGLFPIDFTLIHSMFAAATTYLVILVQFEQMGVPENQEVSTTTQKI